MAHPSWRCRVVASGSHAMNDLASATGVGSRWKKQKMRMGPMPTNTTKCAGLICQNVVVNIEIPKNWKIYLNRLWCPNHNKVYCYKCGKVFAPGFLGWKMFW